MKKYIRFALLGCGAITRKHAESIANHIPNGELVAFCDRDIARAKAYAQQYGVPAFSSLHAMMDKCGAEIDVVCILTPSGLHASNVCDVVKYKKHVIVEKPMALTTNDAKVMVNACKNAGVEMFVVKQNRYNRSIQRLRKAITDKRFGNLIMVTARVRWRRDDAYYKRDAWRGSAAMGGGVLENQGSHHIDLVQWLGGEVSSVFCIKECRLARIEADDTAIVTIRFKSGPIGVIEATTAVRPKDLEGSISVLGEGGSVEIGGFAANQIKTWQFEEPIGDDVETLESFACNPADSPFFAHTSCIQNIVNALLGMEAEIVSGEEGFKTVALLEAMQQSSASNRTVNVRSIGDIS